MCRTAAAIARVSLADAVALDARAARAARPDADRPGAAPRAARSVVVSVVADSSTSFGGRCATPCEANVRRRSTGSPPAPFSSSSTDQRFAIDSGRTRLDLRHSRAGVRNGH